MTVPNIAPSRGSERRHTHYDFWFTGNGAKTEYQISKTFEREEDVAVFVDGLCMRPKNRATNYDYQLRGLTPGYNGDRNTVLFTVAPPNGDYVRISVISA